MRSVATAPQKRESVVELLHKPKAHVPQPVVVEVKEAAPAVVNVDLEGLNQSNQALTNSIIEVLKAQKPATPEPQNAKPTEWQFDVQRDNKGFISGITAKAKE